MKPTITKLDHSRVEIKTTVPADKFDGYRARALKSLGDRIEVDGFRKGNVPANVIEKKVGDAAVLEEMAQLAIVESYPAILAEHKIDAIGRPEIHITKIAAGNDLEFTVTTAVIPTVELADYKKIAKETNKTKIEIVADEKEVEDAIKELRQMRAHQAMHDAGVEHADHNHAAIDEKDLPELNDEFVKSLGKFENVEDFKTKLKENLAKEKENREIEKKRIAIIDGIIDGSTIDLPDMLVDFELDKMMQQFAYDISMTGMTMEDYLTRIEKTEDTLKAEWRVNAIKRAKMQLILEKIAADEKLVPNDTDVQAETQKILEMYKDQKDIAEDRVHAYVTQILTNAKVFEFLEGVK